MWGQFGKKRRIVEMGGGNEGSQRHATLYLNMVKVLNYVVDVLLQ